MVSYRFTFPLDPSPKKRPKVYRYATVNPSKEDEENIRKLYAKMDGKPPEPLNGQIKVKFKFYCRQPKNFPQWKQPYIDAGIIRPNTSPDLDNYIKLILDALNSLLWEDDRYIVEVHATKYYSLEPRTEVEAESIPYPHDKKDADQHFQAGVTSLNDFIQ